MKYKFGMQLTACLLLFYFSVEIIFRRWVWNQVPTQFSAPWVYGLVLLNTVLILCFVWQIGKRVKKTKTEKN